MLGKTVQASPDYSDASQGRTATTQQRLPSLLQSLHLCGVVGLWQYAGSLASST